MKKLYCIFALIVGMMTATTLYAETVNGTCGETMTWTLDTELPLSATKLFRDAVICRPYHCQVLLSALVMVHFMVARQ